VDGLLLNYRAPEALRALDPRLPVVFLDDSVEDDATPGVSFDLVTGARQLARHLADLGHRRVVYLDSPRPWPTFTRRRRYLLDELERLVPGVVVTDARADIGMDAARRVIRAAWPEWAAQRVTAVVTASDVQAHGVLAAFREAGVPVPGRVSVASFDDVPTSAITAPPLTTVHLPAYELGRRAAALLLQLVAGVPGPGAALPTALVPRDSTGPAPAPEGNC
jgi:LacI family transcriptional regulator